MNTAEINKSLFFRLAYDVTTESHGRYNIGTYKEKKLHLILKRYFEQDQNYHEVPCCGYIADILKDNSITEIETSGFTGLNPKLDAYLPAYQVTLVLPLAARKYVSWIDPETGDISPKRLSPKKQNIYTALCECIRIKKHMGNENLRILAVMLEMEEYRMLDGWSRDRKKGSHRFERVPADILDIYELSDKASFAAWIPEACQENFTVETFAKNVKIPTDNARTVIKLMEHMGLLTFTGKSGRKFLYSRTKDS
ncbi:MAG: hypothetical protein E7658_02925 [Ruminococcaceae bacterium]|nr:hypothetical protein [Oscillospiraceae bacterium]